MTTTLSRVHVAAETVAVLMRAGLIAPTTAAEAAAAELLGVHRRTLAEARQRLAAEAWSADNAQPVAGPVPCPPPTADEWEWVGSAALAHWRCERCGRTFHVRRHYDRHMGAR